MKQQIWARILTALSALTLAAMAALILAETFFQTPLSQAWHDFLTLRTPLSVLFALVMALSLLAMAVGCIVSLIPRKTKRRGYVMQRGEEGAIGVSVKSIQGLVQTCVKQYAEVYSADVAVQEKRDGIVILLNIEEAAGVNIPLIVGALQRQIKQYVSECTGMDVREVRVLVENNEDDLPVPHLNPAPMVAAPAVAAAVEHVAVPMPEIPVPEAEDSPELPEAEAAEEAPDAQAEEVPTPVAAPVVLPDRPAMPAMEHEVDDRPLHQRLFGTEEQPAFVPAPPEMPMMIEEIEAAVREEEEACAEDFEDGGAAEESVSVAEGAEEPVEAEEAAAGLTEEVSEVTDEISEDDVVAKVAQAIAMADAEDDVYEVPAEDIDCIGVQDDPDEE